MRQPTRQADQCEPARGPRSTDSRCSEALYGPRRERDVVFPATFALRAASAIDVHDRIDDLSSGTLRVPLALRLLR
jgi:hypothetical protein